MCGNFDQWAKPVFWKYFPMLMLTSVVQCPVLGPERIDMVFTHITRYPQSTKTGRHGKVSQPQPSRGFSVPQCDEKDEKDPLGTRGFPNPSPEDSIHRCRAMPLYSSCC